MFAMAFYIIGVVAAIAVIGLVGGGIIGIVIVGGLLIVPTIGRTILALFWAVELLEAVLAFLFSSRRRAIRRARLASPAHPSANPQLLSEQR